MIVADGARCQCGRFQGARSVSHCGPYEDGSRTRNLPVLHRLLCQLSYLESAKRSSMVRQVRIELTVSGDAPFTAGCDHQGRV